MKDSKKKIAPLELHASIIIYLTCTTIYTNVTQQSLKHNAWLGAIEGYVIGLIYVFIFLSLMSKFQSKTIIEINDIVFGKYIGKVISVIYISIFATQLTDTLFWTSFFIDQTIMPEFSRIMSVILILTISFFSIKDGIMPVLRFAVILAFMGYFILILTYILFAKDIDFSNLFPIEVSFMEVFKGNAIDLDYTYGELIYLFFIIFPNISNTPEVLYKKKKYVYFTLTLGAIYSLFLYIRNSSVLGNLSFMFQYSSLEVVRNLDLGEVFSRLELLFIVQYISIIFYFICIIYYSVIRSTSHLLNINKHRLMGILIGFVLIIINYFLIENLSMPELSVYYDKVFIYVIPELKLGLPILTIIIFYIRKIFRKNKKKEA